MQGPNLRLVDVARAADKFLQTYHSSLTLPIPIENIVESKMGIALFAVPGIRSLIGVDAFISSDFTQITVDENYFTRFPERTRFSIAHEVGHLILHKEWYEKYGPNNFEEYLTSHDRIDEQVYKFTEIQAHTFAGLVLVPTEQLLEELKKRLGKIPSMELPEIIAPAVQDLPEIFQVSDAVILRRLQKEGILKNNS
ncbi:MAG: ImmA/IrrE family metallo-endopeptidase [Candidatus Curtissbacteria bacterium]|nr:ImmA/IrrE family metallo-endopeptidase [Candidatus Curtissbacteria bacterium]